jgi:hypothetical protein
MKLSVKALAITAAILWGGSILLVGIMGMIWPGYGEAYLDMARSIYPGYEAMSGFGGVLVGTVYGLLDGVVCGALFAWLYNRFSGTGAAAAE